MATTALEALSHRAEGVPGDLPASPALQDKTSAQDPLCQQLVDDRRHGAFAEQPLEVLPQEVPTIVAARNYATAGRLRTYAAAEAGVVTPPSSG
jgi:hypothetical protein